MAYTLSHMDDRKVVLLKLLTFRRDMIQVHYAPSLPE